jgi:hypothetical protein
MNTLIEKLHRRAMQLASEGDLARATGAAARSVQLYRQAFQFEARAARLLGDRRQLEPSRSILYRSAASLALQVGEVRECERLAAEGLAGNPPDEIAQELRDVLEQCRTPPTSRIQTGIQYQILKNSGYSDEVRGVLAVA